MLTHTHKKKVVHELMKMLNVVRKNIKNKKCFNIDLKFFILFPICI